MEFMKHKAIKKGFSFIMATSLLGLSFYSIPVYGTEINEKDVKISESTFDSSEYFLKQFGSEELVPEMTLNSTSESTKESLDNSEELKETAEPDEKIKSTKVNISARAGVSVVSNWEEFAAALGDASVTTITLNNDITLSGQLNNVNDIFDKTSVNSDAGLVYLFVKKASISRTLTINGNGNTFDFGNLAIGFVNSSVNTGSHWNITLENIDIKSENLYAPFYYPNVYLASASIPSENFGLTGANATNAKLTIGDNARNIYYVDTFEELIGGIGMISKTDVQLTKDVFTQDNPDNSVDLRFRVPTYNNSVSYVTNLTSPFRDTSGGTRWIYMNPQGIARTLNIDGNGFTLDVGAITICFYDYTVQAPASGAVNWDITWSNINTYHGNYWGLAEYFDIADAAERNQMMRYKNFTNRGAQLIESPLSKMEFEGNVDVRQEDTYTSKRKDGSTIRSWGVNNNNNQTISGSSAVFKKDAKVYMSSTRGPVVHLRAGAGVDSNFVIEEGANVELERTGGGTAGEGSNSVVYIEVGSLFVKSGAKFKATSKDTNYPNILRMNNANSKLEVSKDAVVDLETIGYTGSVNNYNTNPIYMSGGTIDVNGEMNLKGTNMGNSGTHLLYAQNAVNFKVGRQGSLDIQSDSTSGTQNLMYFYNRNSSFKFSDAKRVNLQKTSAVGNTGGLIYMSSGGILEVSVQNVYQWAAGNLLGGVTSEEGGFTHKYEPMSNMKLTYNGATLSSKTGNSMYTDTKDRFLANFTTQGQNRVLFEYVPAPSIEIQSISNDNPEDPNSITIKGYARPSTYIRLWEDPKNGTQSALVKGTEDNVKTPITDAGFDINAVDGDGNPMYTDDPTKNYTVQSDANGDWTYTIAGKDVKHFTANNVINAFGFNNLKSEQKTQIVLDKTAPTGDPVKYYVVKGDTTPDASVFVKNAKDTNPVPEQAKINYKYNTATDINTLMNTVSTDAAPHQVKIDISDSAIDPVSGEAVPNTRTLTAELVVLANPVNIDLDASEITVEYKDIREMTDAELAAWVIKQSGATGYKVDRGGITDLTEKIIVSNLGGLNDISKIVEADGNMVVTLKIPKEDSGLDDYEATVKVKVINLLSVLTVKFVNEADEELPAYTMTLTQKDGVDFVVSDKVDLTDTQYGIQKQIEKLELAGFEISERPSKETEFLLDNTEVTAVYKVNGLVYLSSAPKSINFGTVTYDAKVKRVDDGIYDKDLIVDDTRVTKSKWILGAKLVSQMTNLDDESIKLVDSLQYVNEDQTIILNDGLQSIYQANEEASKNMSRTNISNTWGSTKDSNGIKLVIDPTKSKVLKGQYVGEIEWQFMEATP